MVIKREVLMGIAVTQASPILKLGRAKLQKTSISLPPSTRSYPRRVFCCSYWHATAFIYFLNWHNHRHHEWCAVVADGAGPRWPHLLLQYPNQGNTMDEARRFADPS